MRFWVREIAGWLLVAAGLYAFYLAYLFCRARMMLEAWPVTVFGIFIFRGGIHLLKVAVAARVCLQAQDRLYPAPVLRLQPPAARRGRARGAPPPPTPGSPSTPSTPGSNPSTPGPPGSQARPGL